MKKWIVQGSAPVSIPTIHILSDSVGATGQGVARAAAASFGVLSPSIEVLGNISSPTGMLADLEEHYSFHCEQGVYTPFIVFYTLIADELVDAVKQFVETHDNVIAVDVISNAIEALAQATNTKPSARPGYLHSVNEDYYKRIDAMEFTISHDDGRNPQDLTEADIVLLGVSRSSKTPLSIYLSQLGYKVANVPLDFQSMPPKEIYDVDPTRLFGLIISAELLSNIRKKRLGNAIGVAASYADLECVYEDLEKARALMRKLGCITVRTDNRAIEETAQEILRYYENTHPQVNTSRNNGE